MASAGDSAFRFGNYILFQSRFTTAHGSGRLAGAIQPGMIGIVVSAPNTGLTSVSLRDLSRPLGEVVQDVDVIIAAIPRAKRPSWLSATDLEGPARAADRPGVRLLAGHLSSLAEVAEGLAVLDGVAALEAAVLLASVVYQPDQATILDQEVGEDSRRKADAIRLIDMRLTDPGLTIEGLAAELGVSRATLFRDFGAENGVKAYIRTRRLALARQALNERSGRRPSIAQIAHAHGFSSESHFSRAYSLTYGHAPGSPPPKALRPALATEIPEPSEAIARPMPLPGKNR